LTVQWLNSSTAQLNGSTIQLLDGLTVWWLAGCLLNSSMAQRLNGSTVDGLMA
jgi:hypothetical protein